MPTPYEILDRTLDQITLAQTRWLAWTEPCMRAYGKAFTLHDTALTEVRSSLKAKDEAAWLALNFLLGALLGPWVPRLLTKPQTLMNGAIDELTSAWVKDSLKGLKDDTGKLIQGTAMDKLKSKATGSTYDAYKPVVEQSSDYGSRLRQGIQTRAGDLIQAMIEVKAKADQWTVPAALAFEDAIVHNMPFITDKPTQIGADFEAEFQIKAETEMWIQWALARDEQWWNGNKRKMEPGRLGPMIHQQRKEYQDRETLDERITMEPILKRLLILGIPASAVSSYTLSTGRNGVYGNMQVLDVNKYIQWAKQTRRVPSMVSTVINSGIFKMQTECKCSRIGEH